MEESIRAEFSIPERKLSTMTPQALAYLGDAVYDLVIRTVIVDRDNRSAKRMTREASGYARASAQADLIKSIESELNEEEYDIYRRGRNANPGTKARHATMGEYRLATGFEALLGYLYLKGETGRLLSLIHRGWDKLNET